MMKGLTEGALGGHSSPETFDNRLETSGSGKSGNGAPLILYSAPALLLHHLQLGGLIDVLSQKETCGLIGSQTHS